jgi:protein O-GlcNAc transferase
MWMSVPVITLVGRTVVGRAGRSQLTNLGLNELVAADTEQFIRIAVECANNLPKLADLRQTLRQRMLDSPLTDGNRFCQNIEAAYRTIWKTYCA